MFKLALRNLLRHKIRTAMTLAAIMLGIVGLIVSGGFVQDIYVKLGEALIHSQTGHLQVAKAGFYAQGARQPERYLIEDAARLKQQIAPTPGVADVIARLSFSGLLNNGRTDQAIVGEGVEPGGETRLGSSMVLAAGRQFDAQDREGIMIGQGVASALKLKPGDRVTLVVNTREGAMNTVELEVRGVFQSVSKEYDARAVKIPLAAAQDLLGTPAANALVVVLHRTEDTMRIQAQLKGTLENMGFEVKNWIELNDFYGKVVEFYDNQFGVLRLIVLVMVLLSVVNSVNMSLMERIGEFGTMRALGNRNRRVFMLILSESILLGLAGALLGVVAGVVAALIISAIGISMPAMPNSNIGYTAAIRLTPMLVGGSFLVGFVATVCASILPARYVSRMTVVDALRQNA